MCNSLLCSFWDLSIEDELYKDKIALNLLFVQVEILKYSYDMQKCRINDVSNIKSFFEVNR